METTLSPTRPSNLFGHRFLATMLLVLALAGSVASPAVALPIGGVAPSGGGIIYVAPPDPCLPAPQIISFTAGPSYNSILGPRPQPAVTFGQTVTLSWNVQVPSGCNYLVALLGQSVGLQGSLQVQPMFDTSYTLTLLWGPTLALYTTATTAVSVTVPKDPSDPTGTRNLITISSQQMVPMFVRALNTANTTVIVNGDLDLTGLPSSGESRIKITDGVRLLGGRTAVPGQPFRPGPLLFTTDNPPYLFEIAGDNVRVSGVRIQGPDMGISETTDSVAILISDVMPSCSTPGCGRIPGHINVEIDHNEFSGWSHAGVKVLDNGGKIQVQYWSKIDTGSNPAEVVYSPITEPVWLTTEPVWIHDNFFHHNQHTPGNGYGVGVAYGGHALIERNVFDYNRHAISEEVGSTGSGYRAYRNLVLQNGGWQKISAADMALIGAAVGGAFGALAGLSGDYWYHTQQFDMHGKNNCGLIAPFYKSLWNCGLAGYDYDIRYNSFLYHNAQAIKLRGTPDLPLPAAAVIRFNVFANPNELRLDAIGDLDELQQDTDHAVLHTEGAPLVQDNLTGRTTYPPATTPCDFDGDGIPDTFIATEQTLWYCPGPGDCVTSPGSGKATWVYLNMSTKRVDQLALGYFGGGTVCSVIDGQFISVGGSGPWKPIPTLAQ